MAMEVEVDIAIVGGGLGGLALAVGLQERGLRAHVFEKAPQARPHLGTTINLGPNGLKALAGIKAGLSGRMMTNGTKISRTRGSIRVEGKPDNEYSNPSRGVMCTIPWKSAQRTLEDEIEDASLLHWRHAFVDYAIVEGGVEARFEVPAEEEESVDSSSVQTKVVRAKLLVGVDGMRSQVRKVLVGDEPRDLLHTTWNALVRTEDVSSLNLHETGELRFFSYKNANCAKSAFLLDAGHGLTLWQVRSLDKSGEIKDAYARDLQTHGRDVRKARAFRQTEGLEWVTNLDKVIDGTNPDSIREARAYDRLPVTSWSDSSKHVVLLGDAAHGMYPGPAQGARTAFEDAHQLSILLHEAFSSPSLAAAIPDAVKKFEEVRIPRTTKMQAWAAELTGLPSEIPEWVRDLSLEQQLFRRQEFSVWTNQYPDAMAGDPNSTFWKP